MKSNCGSFLFIIVVSNLLCCSQIKGKNINSPEGVSAPNIPLSDFTCGYRYGLAVHHGVINNKEVHIYYLNTTADKLTSEGFNISVGRMTDDAIYSLAYFNETFGDSLYFTNVLGVAAVGGEPASEIRAYYMAQLGMKVKDTIIWLCDGVLINRNWVLSAAHCFLKPGVEPNLIRLGDYDLTVPVETGTNHRGKFIYDYPINDVIFHPKFKWEERYHDLVLIQLPRKYPELSNRINPICLPWASETNRDLVGTEVILTGWGALHYGGRKTTLLQEVNLKVFNSSVCSESYSKVRNYKKKYPNGITSSNVLCAGWEEGGKAACGGDSGAPITYERGGNFILAGIVSGGYGCGKKEYPGLYIPINNPEYLQWIKETAFKEYL